MARVATSVAPTFARAEGNFLPTNATPQKSFGLREATIRTRRVKAKKSERPY
jgi:hypothetical protein